MLFMISYKKTATFVTRFEIFDFDFSVVLFNLHCHSKITPALFTPGRYFFRGRDLKSGEALNLLCKS